MCHGAAKEHQALRHPGHGRLIENPGEVIDWYLEHRQDRERQVLAALTAAGSAKIADLVPIVYADVDAAHQEIAVYSMHAHLLKLVADGKVAGKTLTGKWSLA